jgi:1-acyl-sn-glycerol-3-phosphate acyltransferase
VRGWVEQIDGVYATDMLHEALVAIRTFVLVPLMFVYTLALATVVIVWGRVNPASPVHDAIVQHWSGLFLRIPPVRVRVEGLERVDPDQRYVVVSNHLSMFDIPLLFRHLPLHGRFLSKKEVFRIPLVGQAMRTIGIIEIDRQAGGSSRQAINDGVAVAAERGYSLLVFPEGTRSRSGELLPFKKGAFRIAIDTGLPLLPVIIEGTDRVQRPEKKIFHRGEVTLRVLDPIDTRSMTNKDDLNPLVDQVQHTMADAYAELRAERPT